MNIWTNRPVQKYGAILFVMAAGVFGYKLEHYMNGLNRTFHNKSALYGGVDLKEGDKLW